MKSSLVRVPIRLGQDSFTVGEISPRNIKRMVKAMKAFKLIMKVNNVKKYMACATSALREANNASEVIQEVKRKRELKFKSSTENARQKLSPPQIFLSPSIKIEPFSLLM